MIDTLLFDLGNVLIVWDPRRLYRRHFATEAEMDAFLTDVCPLSWNHEMDLGKPFATAVAERQRLHPAWAPLIAEWQSGWEHMLGPAIEEMVAALPRLRAAGYRLVAVTNWSAETFPIARARHPWLDEQFDHHVVSGELGIAKPDPAFFEAALSTAGCRPEQALFIDDNAANTAAAERLGIAAITFTSPDACLEALDALGIKGARA